MPITGAWKEDESQPNLVATGEQLAMGALEPRAAERQTNFIVATFAKLLRVGLEFLLENGGKIVVFVATQFQKGEDASEPVFRDLANAAIKDLTGVDNVNAKEAAGKQILEALTGGPGAAPGGQLEPSMAGAEAYMTMVMNLALEGYLETAMFQTLGLGFLDGFGELDDILSQTLGTGRITRQVVGPMLRARVITPAEWLTNKTYRPNLLSAASAVRQFHRGRWTREQMVEELARQGWSDDRIEALVNEGQKFFGASDVRVFLERGHWSNERATQHLMDQGYTENEAGDVLRLEGLKRIEALEQAEAAAIITAYVAREIDEPEFARLLAKAVTPPTERALLTELAELRRSLNVKQLPSSRVRALVKQGILAVADYRRTLISEGWEPFAVDAEELSLMVELQEAADVAAAKAAQEAERQAEREAAAAEKARRELELAAREALPTFAEFRKAYIRGLVPRDRFVEALDRERFALTPEDRAVLLADADLDRAEQLAREEAAAAAAAKKPDPTLPLETYMASVVRQVLTRDQFIGELVARGYDEAEVNLLVADLDERVARQADAEAARVAAAEKAALSGVSLSDFERAVRLGLRSRSDYAAVLARMVPSEVQRALVLDLLDKALADDAAARERRDAQDQAAKDKGISLAQRRRAVVAGVRPRSYYEAALLEAAWPSDDIRVELALLDLELEEAAAARAKRDAIAAELEAKRKADEEKAAAAAAAAQQPPPAPTLTLAQIERAVKLGFLEPDVLRDFLLGKGYAGPDVELLVAMVIADVPDVRAGQQLRGRVAGELAGKGVSLAELERAVRRGLRTIGDFRLELERAGYAADAVDLLAQLLSEEVDFDFLRLREQIGARLEATPDAPSIAELEDALLARQLTTEQLRDVLVLFGVAAETATVYARLASSF